MPATEKGKNINGSKTRVYKGMWLEGSQITSWNQFAHASRISGLKQAELFERLVSEFISTHQDELNKLSTFKLTAQEPEDVPNPELEITLTKINQVKPKTMGAIEFWAGELKKFKTIPRCQHAQLNEALFYLSEQAHKLNEGKHGKI